MSVKFTAPVWQKAHYKGGALTVLLALADYANDEGCCWPSVLTLAKKARVSPRNVNAVLKQFKNDGIVSVEQGGGRGVRNVYRLSLEKISGKGVALKPVSLNSDSVKDAEQTMQSGTENPAEADNAIRKNRKEPSEEPSGVAGSSTDFKTNDQEDAVKIVWEYYLSKLKKNPHLYRLTPERRQKGMRALQRCWELAREPRGENAVYLMKLCVDRLAASAFHQGQNSSGVKYVDWDQLFRDEKKLTWWLDDDHHPDKKRRR